MVFGDARTTVQEFVETAKKETEKAAAEKGGAEKAA
jgi:hypothetical protein